MIEIWLIRHGQTEGNSQGRYIGRRTNEPLSKEGHKHIQALGYPLQEGLFVSPMLRCVETASILFPGQIQYRVPELEECDFGDFENKNYIDLTGNPEYQRWIDSNGTLPFPNGESKAQFRSRSMKGMDKVVSVCMERGWKSASVVVHGGTIMHLMDAYASPKRDFYGWHVKNGGGYKIALDPILWEQGEKLFVVKKSFLEG
ncbi:MAG: histidine phosphatase family protein [Eubacteriales bacterium]|nr:histidine phosphatase family protein [Eubacteriales bacterium]